MSSKIFNLPLSPSFSSSCNCVWRLARLGLGASRHGPIKTPHATVHASTRQWYICAMLARHYLPIGQRQARSTTRPCWAVTTWPKSQTLRLSQSVAKKWANPPYLWTGLACDRDVRPSVRPARMEAIEWLYLLHPFDSGFSLQCGMFRETLTKNKPIFVENYSLHPEISVDMLTKKNLFS